MAPERRVAHPAMPPPPSYEPRAEELLEHLSFVRSLAAALVDDVHAAEDIAQDAVLAALQRPPGIVAGLRTWLRGVVIKRTKQHFRTEGRRTAHVQRLPAGADALAPATSTNTVEDALARAEVSRFLVDAVMSLEEPYRTAVVLRFMEGLKPREIAEVRRQPVATVHTHLQRGLARLRERLDKRYAGDRRAWLAALAGARLPRAGVAGVPAGAVGIGVAAAVFAVVAAAATWISPGAVEGARLGPERVATPTAAVSTSPAARDRAGRALRSVVRAPGLLVRVRDPDGIRVPEASVRVTTADGLERTSEGSEVSFDSEGAVALRVSSPRYATVHRDVTAGTGRVEDVVLEPLVACAIRVVDAADGAPVAGATVVRSTDRALVSDDDGRVTAWGLDGAALVVDVDAPAYLPLREHPIRLAADAPTEIALTPALSLTVRRGEGAGDAYLRLRVRSSSEPEEQPEWLTLEPWRTERVIEALAPGRYDVVAVTHEAEPFVDPDLDGMLGIDWNVSAELAGRVAHRSVLVDRRGVATTVFGREGVDARIRVVAPDDMLDELVVGLEHPVADAFLSSVARRRSGGFLFESVAPGPYVLQVHRGGHVLLRDPVVVPEEGLELEVRLGLSSLDVTGAGDGREHISNHILAGPIVDGEPATRTWDREGPDATFDALLPGRYRLWTHYEPHERTILHEVLIGAAPASVTVRDAEADFHRLTLSAVTAGGDLPSVVDVHDDLGVLIASFDGGRAEEGDDWHVQSWELSPGSYRLVALAPNARYFDEVDLTADRAVAIDWTRTRSFHLSLASGGATLASRVFDLAPEGFGDVEGMFTSMTTAPDGSLEIRVAPGRYRVWTPDGADAIVELDADLHGVVHVELD